MSDDEYKNASETTPAVKAAVEERFVNRVAVRLPPFWADDPEVWFAQAEAQFTVSGVKDDSTKFAMVVSQLDHRYAKEIKDVIKNPPAVNKYDTVKNELIKRLSISREQQISQLLSHEELGDRKPSQFLRHLKNMAAGGVTDEFLRSMWMSRLPPHAQAILMAQTSADLEQIAEQADKILEVIPSSSSSNVAATSVNNYDGLLKKIDDLITARIQSEMSQQIAKLSIGQERGRSSSRMPHHRRSASRSRSRSRGWSQSRTPGVCWYHDRFGNKASKCTIPCNYASGKANDSQ